MEEIVNSSCQDSLVPCHVLQGCHASLPGSARPCPCTHVSCVGNQSRKLLITFEVVLIYLNCSAVISFVLNVSLTVKLTEYFQIMFSELTDCVLGFNSLPLVLCSCTGYRHVHLNYRLNARFHRTQVLCCAVSRNAGDTFWTLNISRTNVTFEQSFRWENSLDISVLELWCFVWWEMFEKIRRFVFYHW
jgi:hypothetical protein